MSYIPMDNEPEHASLITRLVGRLNRLEDGLNRFEDRLRPGRDIAQPKITLNVLIGTCALGAAIGAAICGKGKTNPALDENTYYIVAGLFYFIAVAQYLSYRRNRD